MPSLVTVDAEPEPLGIDPAKTAVVIIDMQRDFLEPGGFGESLGNDVSLLKKAIEPCKALLAMARAKGILIIHTREGHRPDLSDAPKAKVERGDPSTRIGALGPMGRILIRGEAGHDIIPELYPLPGEPIIDKPGKGAFYATDLGSILQHRGIESLIVCGVTTEVCVHTTVPGDCCGSYFPEFHEMGLRMIKAQGGIFGWVSDSKKLVSALG
jgi:biuret amidohydrolase